MSTRHMSVHSMMTRREELAILRSENEEQRKLIQELQAQNQQLQAQNDQLQNEVQESTANFSRLNEVVQEHARILQEMQEYFNN